MNRRVLLSGFLVVMCLMTLWGIWDQRNQLAGMRADQQQLQAQLAAKADVPPLPVTAPSTASPQPALVVTPELLRLRNEVTRLTERRRELAGARAENERLHAQLVNRGTNGPGGFQLPPGYVRRTEARMVGYNAPEDTLQSMLWAIQNRDLTNLLQAFTPEMATEISAGIAKSNKSIGDFFRDGAGFVGMSVVGRTEDHTSAGSIYVEVEVFPGMPHQQIRFRQSDGQWKIAGPF
jgi:hypothetical protein